MVYFLDNEYVIQVFLLFYGILIAQILWTFVNFSGSEKIKLNKLIVKLITHINDKLLAIKTTLK